MSNENVIEVANLSKKFSKNIKSSKVQLKNIFIDTIFNLDSKPGIQENEFYALDDISFTVKKNEKLAILGSNGSGKSTLLKILNGIYIPDSGQVQIDGVVSSVLELSTGFVNELTGFDNIYLKFALQGRTKEEVDLIIDDVIDSSDLREFMDTQLKHYSSGMKSKLGFAIATSINPDILILDEVFAAGDKKFRDKSEKRIKELYKDTTTILVTHSMSIVKELAERVIVLDKGKMVFEGNANLGIAFYNKMMKPKKDVGSFSSANRYTVVTPVYNVEKYLDEYFKSIVEQTLNFENSIYMILVDDGSIDNSAEIILKWKSKFPNNITYIKKKNGGVASARNLGLEHVQTDWVTFIDASDMINDIYFEEVDKCVVDDNMIDVVSCNQIFYIEETTELKKHFLSYRFKSKKKVVNPINMQNYIEASVNSVFFKFNHIKKFNLRFDEKIIPVFEDGYFVNKLFVENKSINIAFLKNAEYFFRKRLDDSGLVNANWQKSSRYLDALEFGLLNLLIEADLKCKEVPIYLQRFVLYQLQFYFKRVVNDGDKLEFLTQEELKKFKNLLDKIFKYIEAQTIEVCALGGLWHKYRVGFYNLYKDKTIFKQVCYIDGYDLINKELKLHYFTHSVIQEEFFLNGEVLQPSKEEIVEHYFLDKLFVYEKIIYIKLVGEWEYFDAILGSIETQISLNSKRYKKGIQVKAFHTTLIK